MMMSFIETYKDRTYVTNQLGEYCSRIELKGVEDGEQGFETSYLSELKKHQKVDEGRQVC